MGAVPKSVPTAVAPSTGNSVSVNEKAQRGPYKPMSGSSYVPYVPGNADSEEVHSQPGYGGAPADTGSVRESGGAGAPSVPAQTSVLWKAGPADPHYTNPYQGGTDPYKKVNNPPTRGLFTWVQKYANHIFNGKQNVDNAGWQQSGPQQRTSVMRITPPAHGGGYAPETFTPRQLPQSDATYKFNPITGNDQPGPRILNRTTYGAGQTAGGVGGNQYTPTPGPPETNSTAQSTPQGNGMPMWG